MPLLPPAPFLCNMLSLYFLLLLGGTLADDPCISGNYTMYNGSTAHKGASDDTAWDWDSDTACDFYSDEGKMLDTTCGRCDARFLDKGVWHEPTESVNTVP